MEIEQELKQEKPFRNSRQKAIVNLIYTHNCLQSKHKSFLQVYDITLQQYNVLRILRGKHPEPISTSWIRERMLDRKSDASRIVDRMVKKGLVVRKTCKTDKRLVDVVISESGLSLLARIDAEMGYIENLTHHLDEAEIDTFNQLLDKIRSGIREA